MADELTDLREALLALRTQSAEARLLASEVLVRPVVPVPHPGTLRRPPPAPPPPTSVTAQAVVEGWSSGGENWAEQLGRRDLMAALRLLGIPFAGRRLVELEGLATSLVALADRRLRAPRFMEALAQIWFLNHPPTPAFSARLERARGELDAALLPRWLREVGANAAGVLRCAGAAFRLHPVEVALGEWDLPPSLVDGPWVEEIARRERPASIEELERLMLLADHGQLLRAPAAVSEAVRHVARSAVSLGHRMVDARRRIVSLLRGRIGELFGEAGRPRWAGLEEQHRTLRSWVAGEFMDVIFQHVHPDSMNWHQLVQRQKFWRQYAGAVDGLSVYVKEGRAQLLAHPDVAKIVKDFEGMVRIGTLDDSPTRRHAILVMEMQGTTGPVSVVEGNSMAKVRVRPKRVALPSHRISYRAHITQGEFEDPPAFARMHDTSGNWMGLVRAELARYGIRETSS
jgi:hypothetical protein